MKIENVNRPIENIQADWEAVNPLPPSSIDVDKGIVKTDQA